MKLCQISHTQRVRIHETLKILSKQHFCFPSLSAVGLMLMKCNGIMHIIHTRVDAGSKIHSSKSSEYLL